MLRLGVLDQSPVRSGGVVSDAIHETLELAELCDRLGYHRYWLAEHPAVFEVAVVAMPDERWGERPKAFVELKDGEQADEDEIISFGKERLARYKCPSAVEFCELPRTSTGKVQKFVLREKEWEGREKAIG